MKRVFLFAVVTLCVIGCAGRNEQKGFARRPEVKSGKSAFGSGRNQQIPDQPRILPETNYAAGRVFEQQGAPDKAIEQYRKAIAVNHNYTAAYARLGLMLSLTGQHEESVEAFTKAVVLKPGSAILRNNLGFELLYLERWDEAEQHLRTAAQLDPKLSQAHINLGLLLGRTKRYEEAVASFRMVLPEPDAYYNLALLQRAQGRYPEAASSLRYVVTINPEFTAAQKQLVQVERKIAAADATPPIVAKTAEILPESVAQDIKPSTEKPDRSTSSTTTSTTIVDLGSLIHEIFPEPTISETHPAAAQTVTTIPEPTIGETHPVTVPSTPTVPEPATVEIKQPTTTDTTSMAKPVVDDTAIIPVRSIESFKEEEAAIRIQPTTNIVTTTTTTSIPPQPQPLQWDLTLADLARAINTADSQKSALGEVKAITMESESLPPCRETQEIPGDTFVGPPQPAAEEVVLVLDANESRINPLPTNPVPVTTVADPGHRQSMKMLDDMEISLQILRNEIQCQKENDSVSDEDRGQIRMEKVVPVNDQPVVPSTVDPNKRTEAWPTTEFQAMETLLSVIRNDSMCIEDAALAQINPEIREQEGTLEQPATAYQYGPAYYAAPSTTPRRVRGAGRASD